MTIGTKNIYIEPDEEIVSIIDRLVKIENEKVNLVVPSGAQIWQSSINLKLLKREADNLGKEITLVISDDLGLEMAEKIGFVVKKSRDFPIELVQEEKNNQVPGQKIKSSKEDMIDRLVEELKLDDRPSLAGFRSRKTEPRRKMVDIVDPGQDIKVNFFRKQFSRKKPLIKKAPVQEQTRTEPIPAIETIPLRETASKWPKFFIIFIGLTFLVAAIVSYLILPTTEITIFPKTEKVSFDLIVIGSKSLSQISQSLNKIPLQEIEVKKTKIKEFLATGEKQLNEKARGSITIYNEYSSSPQTLVATTRFESPDGKVFRILKNIIVPGAKIEEGKIVSSSIDVEVVADQPGADYNIGPTNFTVPGFRGTAKYAGFYGRSEASMIGGSIEKVKVVLAEDIENAEENLMGQLKNEVKQALQEQIPSDLTVVENGLKEETIKVSSSIEADAQVDKFTIEIEALVRTLLFNEEDLKKLIDLNLAAMVSENKTPLSGTQQIVWQEPAIDWSEGEVIFSLHIEEEVAWQIDISTLKQDLAGQSEVEVRKYLASRPGIERAKVTFWPFWVKRIPTQEKKIKIELSQSQD